jgi:hypothetical protein
MVIIDKSVNSIGEGSFEGCSGLKEVFIPDSVTSIEEEAFYGCSGLTEVFIPEEAFSGIRMHHIKIPKPF